MKSPSQPEKRVKDLRSTSEADKWWEQVASECPAGRSLEEHKSGWYGHLDTLWGRVCHSDYLVAGKKLITDGVANPSTYQLFAEAASRIYRDNP